jgi:hypothetical protein
MDLKKSVSVCGMDSPLSGSCEHDNELSSSLKARVII